MRKRHILIAGLIVLMTLLFCTIAAAQTQTPQPSKSADQWEKDGYQVIRLNNHFFGEDAGTVNGFLVLRNDINYLRAINVDGFQPDGNRFSLKEMTPIQTAGNDESKYASLTCIRAGDKYYFGNRGSTSDESTLVLEEMITLDHRSYSSVAEAPSDHHPYDLAVTAYTVGAWIDWKIDFKLDLSEECPFYADGYFQVYLDHKSDVTPWYEPTQHTIEYYESIHFNHVGLKTTERTTEKYTIGIGKEGIKPVNINLRLNNFEGELEWNADALLGIEILFKSYGPAVWDFEAIPHPKDGVTINKLARAKTTGDLDLDIDVGFEAGSKLVLIDSVELDVTLIGLTLTGTQNGWKLIDKLEWHTCGECFDEDLRARMGPVRGIIDMTGLDPQTVFESPSIDLGEVDHFYTSMDYDESGDGECPHWAWYTQVNVQSSVDSSPLPNVDVRYEHDPRITDHYYGTTGADGTVDLYIPAGSYPKEIIASLTSPLDPTLKITNYAVLEKKEKTDTVTIKMNIPMKTVSFKNTGSGDPTDWPADIHYSPFYTHTVTLPNKLPELSGRVFTGWNTKEDGSGTSYFPGETLSLEDNLTLWAQWKNAEDTWVVSYNANGGTKAPGSQIVRKGHNAILSSVRPEGGKMIFKGWTPDKQHPETVYQPGDTLRYDSEKNVVVLYALWDLSPVPEPIHISFSANGLQDAVMPADIWSEMDTWLQLEPAFAPAGSPVSFLGWSEDPSAAKPEYQADRSYYFFRDTQLFAIWDKLDTVTLTFLDSLPDTSSGIPKPISILPSMSRNVYIPDQIPQKSGRIFTGWNTRKDGSGTAYAPGTVIVLQKNAVLWAQWARAEDSWYVVFNANGGTKAPGAQIIPIGQDAELTAELPENGTLTFKGWALSPDEAAAEYQPGDKLKYDSGKNYVVLYALWDLSPERRPAVITFKANGGLPDTVPHSISRPKMVWFELPESEPVWDAQHLFLGWSDNPEDTEAKWKAGDIAVFNQDTTLYAIWRAQYTVISGAGSVWIRNSSSSLRFIADGDIKYFVELLIDGKRFAKGVKITSGSTVAEIAPWALETLSEGTHTITFRYEDGEASAPFTISDLPVTGDRSVPALWLLLAVFGLAGMTLAGIRAFGQKKQ